MRRIKFKNVLILFRLFLFIQLYYHHQFTLVAAIENGRESNFNNESANTGQDEVNLNERMKKMEDRSRLQEQEIAQLSTNAVKDREVINQLNDRVAELEGASTFASS